jgi:hypothetical protein
LEVLKKILFHSRPFATSGKPSSGPATSLGIKGLRGCPASEYRGSPPASAGETGVTENALKTVRLSSNTAGSPAFFHPGESLLGEKAKVNSA